VVTFITPISVLAKTHRYASRHAGRAESQVPALKSY